MSGYQTKDDFYERRNTDGLYKNQENYEILESGGMVYNAGTGEDAAYDMDKALRMGFIRKVYGILSLQLLLTAAVATVCVLCDPVRSFIFQNVWTVYVGFLLSIVVLVALMCFRDKYPTNMYLLVLWTFLEAYMVGVVCAAYATVGQGFVVVQAAALTMAVFLGLTLFTFQTKIDFSFMGGALFASLWILCIWGFIMAVFGFRQSYLYSLAGAIIFSLFILYDTSLLMNKLGYDEYIVASINLYLDIINLFLYILRLLSNRNNS